MKWHPDRNPASDATDKFREIAEAYAVLSDPTKRRAYDAGGHAGVSERWSTEDLFRDFDFGSVFGRGFEGLGGIFDHFFSRSGRHGSAKPRGDDLRYELTLTLDEAARGGERLVEIRRTERCRTCGGNGASPGTAPIQCPQCQGTGQKQKITTQKALKIVALISCDRCRGRGIWIESPCATCKGSGFELLPHKIQVNVPPGVEHGTVLRLGGEGEPAPEGGRPGDLLFCIKIEPHPSLRRQGDHLYTVVGVNFVDAALGSELIAACLEGAKVRVKVPAGTQSGTALRVRGKGMPRLGGKGRGDLFVIVEVKTPTNLTARQRELLQEFKLGGERDAQRSRSPGQNSNSSTAAENVAISDEP